MVSITAVSDLDALRKPGEALRPSDLLKGVKLTGGDSVTPQMALMQTMAAMHKKVKNELIIVAYFVVSTSNII